MVQHFAPKAPATVPTHKSIAHWTAFDYLHTLSRFLFSLYFLYSLLHSLRNVDRTFAHLSDLGVPDSLVQSVFIFSIGLALVGSALFVAGVDSLGLSLLAAHLIPLALLDDVYPLLYLSGKWTDAEVHRAVVDVLKTTSMAAAMFVIWAFTQHVEWLETENRAEVKRALTAWYDKQEREGKGKAPTAEEERKEVKKVR
jgi:hypothetical protein